MSQDVLRVDGSKVTQARLALPTVGTRPVSQAAVADKAGIHWVTLSNIERGKAANITLETLGRLAEALGVDPMSLTAEDNGASDRKVA